MSPYEILEQENASLRDELIEVKNDLDLADEINYDEVESLKTYCWVFMIVAYIEFIYIIVN